MSFDPVSYALGLRGGIGRDIVSSLMGRIKGGGGGGSTDTELDFTLTSDLTQHLYLTQSAPGAVTVDWGDGSQPESPSDLAASLSHTHAEAGNYTVRISCATGETWSPGLVSGSDKYGIIGKYTTKTDTYPTLTSARLGAGARLNVGYAFTQCTGLAGIAMTGDITTVPDYAFNKCTGLTSVTIPSGVTSIGTNAFYGCTGLTSVTIPSSVMSIGVSAFYGCTGLTSVTIPDSVTSIGGSAFSNCSGLTGVYIEDLGAWCGINFGNNQSNPCSNAHNLYLNGTLLTSVTIPDNVTSIGSLAFYGCSSLTSVTIPSSVTSIGANAFNGCTGLMSVTIDMTTIPDAFKGMTSIQSVHIGEHTAAVVSSAFQGCSGLTGVYIEDLGAWCGINFGNNQSNPCSNAHNLYLNGTLLTSVTIPDNVTSIGSLAFYGCSSLTSVTIPDSVTSIGSLAFQGCSGLTGVYIEDLGAWCGINFGNNRSNPCSYAHNLYLNGTLLTSVTIPDSVTSIGGSAFYGCTGLTSVTIPDSVTSIGGSAFYGCTGLTSVTIPDSVTSIGTAAFDGCSGLTRVYIEDLGAWCGIDFVNESANPCSIAHNLYLNGTRLESVTIPSDVTSIGQYAFSTCKGLKNVTIPNSVTSIGNYTFHNCSGVHKITSNPTIPPALGEGAITGVPADCAIYVPSTSVAAYQAATGWSDRSAYIQAIAA